MKKALLGFIVAAVFLVSSTTGLAQEIFIGPRLTGNMNIFNMKGLTGTWNGIGIGVGGSLNMHFSKHIGIMTNLTAFDMKGFSNSTTANGVTTDVSYSLSYFELDPLFKASIGGFYFVGGPSLGLKLGSSGEGTRSATGQTPQTATLSPDTKSMIFNLAAGTGYAFPVSKDMDFGFDFIIYVPITDTYNLPGTSNSVLSLKLGTWLGFKL